VSVLIVQETEALKRAQKALSLEDVSLLSTRVEAYEGFYPRFTDIEKLHEIKLQLRWLKEELDDEALSAFSNNAIYHAWPYWREHHHNMAGRLGLPVMQLPVMRVVSA